MRQRFQSRQSEEAARALDGVDQPENVIQDLGVVRLLFELHQLIVHGVQALAGFRQKLPQQIIHENRPSYREGAHTRRDAPIRNGASFTAKRLIMVEYVEKNGTNKEIRRSGQAEAPRKDSINV
ncbi:hypothetical protein ACVWZK_008102 [Bradyrhizobium sp. GM0.4]